MNAVSTNASTAAELFAAAVARHQAGNLAEAERLYRQILTLEPGHIDSLHNLGLVAFARGDPASAVELIGQAIATNDRVPEFHYNIALALHGLGRSPDAASALQRAVELRVDYPAAHLNLGNIHRELGQLAEAAASYERALAHAPNFEEARFNLANVLAEQGRWDAAIAAYRHVLAIHPNHADSHNNLGAAFMTQGKYADAISHLERALALKPDLLDAYRHLGQAYMLAGQYPQALAAARRGLELKETDTGKEFFAQCARFVRFSSDDGGFRHLLLRAVSEAWARPSDLVRVGVGLIMLNGAVSGAAARANAAWPALLSAQELFGPSGLAGIASDELLRAFMESAALTDVGLERLLINARAVLLTHAESSGPAPAAAELAFWCALARQCFVNQYAYALSDEEAERAARLRDALATALDAGGPVPALWPVAIGAYFPLHEMPNHAALLACTWPAGVDDLISQQVTQPAQERGYRAMIPALTGIGDGVSREVRRQYEENPYPRWVKAGPATQPVVFKGMPPGQSLEILIAGCGTGQYTIEFARHARDARFLAIDLSISSLCYAKRMADSFGLTNIEFAQADIMRLAGIDRTFDVIEAGGVLHHLADPWEGWRVLLSLLRPGGVMQVGLYSALARQGVAAARSLIAERGYRPIPQDIRRCREELMAAADGTPLKSLTVWHDFFTTGECRDLLFHPQEHCFTLPDIKAFLAANDLHFAGFVLDAPIEQRFSARFPGRAVLTDLDRWHTYETENPGTFASMYQFWVQKPGAAGVTAKLL